MNKHIEKLMFFHDIRVVWYDPILNHVFLTLPTVNTKKYKRCYILGFL
jgi:hypothetical protein